MEVFVVVITAFLVLPRVSAAPTAAVRARSVAYNGTLPFALPATWPHSPVRIDSQGTGETLPRQFGLYGYSYDGHLVNQIFITDPAGFLREPGSNSNNGGPLGLSNFASNLDNSVFTLTSAGNLQGVSSKRIATYTALGGKDLGWTLFQLLSFLHPAPTCQIIEFYNALYCYSGSTPLQFAYCDSKVDQGLGYSPNSVIWGSSTGPCTPMIFEVVAT